MTAQELSESIAKLIVALPYPAVSCVVDNIARVDQLEAISEINATFAACVRSRFRSFAHVVIGRPNTSPTSDSRSLIVGHNVDDDLDEWMRAVSEETALLPLQHSSSLGRVTICTPDLSTVMTTTMLGRVALRLHPRCERLHVSIERHATNRAHVLLANLFTLVEERTKTPPVELVVHAECYSWSHRGMHAEDEDDITLAIWDIAHLVSMCHTGVHLDVYLVCGNRLSPIVRELIIDDETQKYECVEKLSSLDCSASMWDDGDVYMIEFDEDTTRCVRIHFLTSP